MAEKGRVALTALMLCGALAGWGAFAGHSLAGLGCGSAHTDAYT